MSGVGLSISVFQIFFQAMCILSITKTGVEGGTLWQILEKEGEVLIKIPIMPLGV